jgi:RNA polymerase sigma-70 factor (ECF subfamily)
MAIKDLDPETLEQTLLGVSQKSRKAFNMFFQHYYPPLVAFVRRIVGDDDLAREVAQDALMAVPGGLHTFKGDAKFSTWLCAIARHKGMDALRARGRQPEHGALPLDEPECLDLPDLTPWGDVAAEVDRRQLHRRYRLCMDAVPALQREVATLSMDEEWAEAEVADELRCPLGTVKSRLFAARKALQKCMNGWYQEMKRV